jgi:hypothetical protein
MVSEVIRVDMHECNSRAFDDYGIWMKHILAHSRLVYTAKRQILFRPGCRSRHNYFLTTLALGCPVAVTVCLRHHFCLAFCSMYSCIIIYPTTTHQYNSIHRITHDHRPLKSQS